MRGVRGKVFWVGDRLIMVLRYFGCSTVLSDRDDVPRYKAKVL